MYPAVPPEVTQVYNPFYTGVDQGAVVTHLGVPFTRNDPPATYTLYDACGASGPYNGTLGNCNLLGDCTQNQTGPAVVVPTGPVVTYNNPALSPGPTYTADRHRPAHGAGPAHRLRSDLPAHREPGQRQLRTPGVVLAGDRPGR